MPFRKGMTRLAAVAAALACCAAAPPPSPEQQAAQKAYVAESYVPWVLRRCGSVMPEVAEPVRFFEHFWRTDELAVTLAAQPLWSAADEATRKAQDHALDEKIVGFDTAMGSTDARGRQALCDDFIQHVLDGAYNFQAVDPDSAKVLTTVFDSHPELVRKKRNADFVTGCMKGVWNAGGRDFPKAKGYCDCIIHKTILDGRSDEEVDRRIVEIKGHAPDAQAAQSCRAQFPVK